MRKGRKALIAGIQCEVLVSPHPNRDFRVQYIFVVKLISDDGLTFYVAQHSVGNEPRITFETDTQPMRFKTAADALVIAKDILETCATQES